MRLSKQESYSGEEGWWVATSYAELVEVAILMGQKPEWAVAKRITALTQHIAEMEELRSRADFMRVVDNSEVAAVFIARWIEEIDSGIAKAQREITSLRDKERGRSKVSADTITDAMIEAARAVPVNTLVDFGRGGKVKAWCHDDRNPSMYHGTRSNRAVCPVCDKKFGPIDVLVERDGMSFAEAVRYLAG